MSMRGKSGYTPARLWVLRWLTDTGANVAPHIRALMLSEIFASQNTVIVAVLSGLLINTVAQCLAGGRVFLEFMAMDILLAVCRVWTVRKGAAASLIRQPTPTDTYLLSSICWYLLQGIIAYTAIRTGNMVLSVLATFTVVGITGPTCARYYPTPRYALLLISLCDFPFAAGALMTGNRWMVAIILQLVLLILGCISVIQRLQRMAVALLEAEYASQQRAERDTLTGLLNRAGLMDVLLGLEAAGTRFVLFYLDLDGFKAVNDTMGHLAGDALLQAVAAQLQATMRESDTVARLGGDEFVVVTPSLGPAESAALASGIIQRIMDQDYSLGTKGDARVGVSIGYACWPEDGPTLELLQNHADSALYEAKKAGKGVHRRFVGPDVAGIKEDLGLSGAV